MHVNVQLRFNPATGQEAPYYRLKESYRDVRGNVHSLIVLNIGFEPRSPEAAKRLGVWTMALPRPLYPNRFYRRYKLNQT